MLVEGQDKDGRGELQKERRIRKYSVSETRCCIQTLTKAYTHTHTPTGINTSILTSWAEQGHIRDADKKNSKLREERSG